jgi:uncharacterized membrane protein YeaQ/YmgE (transglycosylase-associated protein family)
MTKHAGNVYNFDQSRAASIDWSLCRRVMRLSITLPSNNNMERVVGFLTWIILGLVAGLIAKFVMPGNDPGGLLITILVGIAGAVIGGFVASAIGFGAVSGINIQSIGIAAVGAFVLLFARRMLKRI